MLIPAGGLNAGPVKIKRLLGFYKKNFSFLGNIDASFGGLSFDSRTLNSGDMFFALKGTQYDGHKFLPRAQKKGAAGFAVDLRFLAQGWEAFQGKNIFCVGVDDARDFLSWASKVLYGIRDNDFEIVGVTGTDGKTTTSFLIENILRASGRRVARMGTLGTSLRKAIPLGYTTLPAPALYCLLNRARKTNIRSLVLEVSSQGLEQKRVEHLRFDVGVFTNIARDHLDYHKTLNSYIRCKLHLLDLIKSRGGVVVNSDCRLLFNAFRDRAFSGKTVLFSLRDRRAQISLKGVCRRGFVQHVSLNTPLGAVNVRTRLLGRHNIYNIMASVGAAMFFKGITRRDIAEGVERTLNIHGRFNILRYNGRIGIVDYAHTPQALREVLYAARPLGKGRLILVFGCGGDRDRKKRPQMGMIASCTADKVFIANDNPRSENPQSIIDDILKGVRKRSDVSIVKDRRRAIKKAVEISRKGDIILVAGKGHERYQIIGSKRIDFDDLQVLKGYLKIVEA